MPPPRVDPIQSQASRIGVAPIAVIMPAWNEEGSIGRVIDDLPKDLVSRIVVADNNSTDYTADVAGKFGATVIPATRQGYGSACLAAIAHLESLPVDQQPEIVVFIDADYSDHPEQLPLLVDPILRGEADFVIGSRMLKPQPKGALLPQAIFGNKLVGVIPGIVLTSRMTSFPRSETIMSTLVAPLHPRARWASRAWVMTPRYRSAESLAGMM